MFDSNVNRDDAAKKVTRRAFVGGGVATAVGLAVVVAWQGPGADARAEASTTVHGTPGQVTIVNFNDDGKNLGPEKVDKVVKTDGDWMKQLGKNSYGISRMADTEMPYSGANLNEHHKGVFRCVGCDTALFSSETKFDSGTGWPSFWAAIAKQNVLEKTDSTLGMDRTEVKCARCEGHLGHVFDDGPRPTGLRYCMNSAAMRFAKAS